MLKLNDQAITTEVSPDGKVLLDPSSKDLISITNNVIYMDFKDANDLVVLTSLVSMIRNEDPTTSLYLEISYLPQYKLNDGMYVVDVYAKIINSLDFTKVLIWEPYSKEVINLFNSSVAIDSVLCVFNHLATNYDKDDTIVVCNKEYAPLYESLDYKLLTLSSDISSMIYEIDLYKEENSLEDKNVIVLSPLGCNDDNLTKTLINELAYAKVSTIDFIYNKLDASITEYGGILDRSTSSLDSLKHVSKIYTCDDTYFYGGKIINLNFLVKGYTKQYIRQDKWGV